MNNFAGSLALPAAGRHAGHITGCHDSAGHSLISGLCRVPDPWAMRARCWSRACPVGA